MEKFISTMNREELCFQYLSKKFAANNHAKIKKGITVSCVIGKLINIYKSLASAWLSVYFLYSHLYHLLNSMKIIAELY